LPEAGLSGIPARNHEGKRRVADFRRGDDRLPARAGGAQERFGINTGFDVSWQKSSAAGCRWARSAGGRISWIARAARAGLPGRHVERQPLAMAAALRRSNTVGGAGYHESLN